MNETRRQQMVEEQLEARRKKEWWRKTLISMCPCGCFGEAPSHLTIESEEERLEFKRRVEWLGAVPLFKKQLPKDEIPKVAEILVQQEWSPESKVIQQGVEGKSFFIIVSGEALVVTEEADGTETELATLYHMDYFGGHTLQARRNNIATIKAKGPDPLVTYCCSREKFIEAGFNSKLKFPRRPAIYDGKDVRQQELVRGGTLKSLASGFPEEISEEDVQTIVRHVEHNANLRARTASLQSQTVAKMAKRAHRRDVREGEEICKGGDLGNKFFVIMEGSFDVIPNAWVSTHQSAEAVLASRSMTERLVRKQRFLIELMKKGSSHDLPQEGASLSGLERNFSRRHSDKGGDLHSPKFSEAPLPWEKVTSTSAEIDISDDALSSPTASSPVSSWVGGTKWGSKTEGARPRRGTTDIFSGSSSPKSSSRNRGRTVTEGAHVLRSAIEEEDDDDEEDDNPFKVGDMVQRVIVGGDSQFQKESGRVIEILKEGSEGEVVVEFDEKAGGKVNVGVACLRPAAELAPISTLEKGSCFGELSLLYNTRQVATCRAREDSVVYEIENKHFQDCFCRSSPKTDDHVKLLDEVHLLNPLLRAERAEVARKATGLFQFNPHEVVIREGEVRPERCWYVVESHHCILTMTNEGVTQELAKLRRGAHFGERQILMGKSASEFTVTAGPKGLSCLVIDGEILENLPLDVETILQGDSSQLSQLQGAQRGAPKVPRVESDVASYVKNLKQSEVKFDVPLEKLELVGHLGEGGFGSVLLAQYEGKDYALKRLSKGWVVHSNVQSAVASERDLLAMLQTPFIIQFYKSYRDDQWVYMLLEYCAGGHLLGVMENHREVLLDDYPRGSSSMFYTASVSYALEYLHDRNIMYRDLKLENVLLDERGYAKLCDLGFARFVHGKSNTQAGTPDYMAPELIDPPHAHDAMVDWYAVGVMCCELCIGQLPYDDQGLDDIQLCLEAIRMQQDKGIPKGFFGAQLVLAEDFVRKLLTVSPKKRLGSIGDGKEVRDHGWFESLKFDFEGLLQQTCPTPLQVEKKVMERKLGKTRTVADHLQIQTDLFRVYEEDMPNNFDPNWDDCFG